MEGTILVAYATTGGATLEVAEVVTDELRRQAPVDLRPARAVRSLAGYGAVVLGAPLYVMHLHRDATRFLSQQQKRLAGLPVALFAGGPFGEASADAWQAVRQQLDRDLARFPWLMPVSTLLVGGRFDPARLRSPYTLIPGLRRMPPSDLRDWQAIRAWAGSLPALLAAPARPAERI